MSPLRHRDFRRLWLAGLISDAGDWLLLVSLPILVFELTGSTLQTSVAFLVELAPAVLLGPFAGYLADRWDRRRLLVTVTIVQAFALLPLLAVHERGDLPILYAVVAVEAAMLTLFTPAKNAMLPTLVPAEQLVSANSLVGLNQNLGRLVGGPVGGLLLAATGLPVIVVVDLCTFVAAAVLIAGVRGTAAGAGQPAAQGPAAQGPAAQGPAAQGPAAQGPAAQGPAAQPKQRAFAGHRIRVGLAVAALGGLAQGIFVVLFVVWVARELGGGASETGLLRGVQAVGAIAAGLLLATARRTPAPAALTATGAGAFGLILLVLWNAPAVTTALPLYVALFVLVGAPGLAMITGLISVLQQESSDRVRGRVFGVFGAVYDGSSAAGMVAAGVLGDRVGVLPMLNGQAILYLSAGTAALLLLRRAAVSRPGTLEPAGR